jgi:hypothetical protein
MFLEHSRGLGAMFGNLIPRTAIPPVAGPRGVGLKDHERASPHLAGFIAQLGCKHFYPGIVADDQERPGTGGVGHGFLQNRLRRREIETVDEMDRWFGMPGFLDSFPGFAGSFGGAAENSVGNPLMLLHPKGHIRSCLPATRVEWSIHIEQSLIRPIALGVSQQH